LFGSFYYTNPSFIQSTEKFTKQENGITEERKSKAKFSSISIDLYSPEILFRLPDRLVSEPLQALRLLVFHIHDHYAF
jgi:hypothetical protein